MDRDCRSLYCIYETESRQEIERRRVRRNSGSNFETRSNAIDALVAICRKSSEYDKCLCVQLFVCRSGKIRGSCRNYVCLHVRYWGGMVCGKSECTKISPN